MANFGKWLAGCFSLGLVLSLAACAPNSAQLRKALEEDPEILYGAMRKDPLKFLDVVNEVAEKARTQKMTAQYEEGFSKPLKVEVDENRTFDGAKNAPVTIVEYSDFQCGYCSQGHETVKQVMSQYGGKVRVLLKHFPIDRIHPQARKMSQIYEAMATKNKAKALEFKSRLFTMQGEFMPNESEKASKKRDEFMAKYNKRVDADLAKLVKSMGFDYAELKKIGESASVTAMIAKDQEEARTFGIEGTPAYIVNGVALMGSTPPEVFKQVIDRHLKTTN